MNPSALSSPLWKFPDPYLTSFTIILLESFSILLQFPRKVPTMSFTESYQSICRCMMYEKRWDFFTGCSCFSRYLFIICGYNHNRSGKELNIDVSHTSFPSLLKKAPVRRQRRGVFFMPLFSSRRSEQRLFMLRSLDLQQKALDAALVQADAALRVLHQLVF